MDARDMLRVLQTEQGADAGAPVAAYRTVALVAERGHQRRPGRGDPLDAPAGTIWLPAEPVTRQRRADDVKGVSRVVRVRQRPDDLAELDHRAGPAVRND